MVDWTSYWLGSGVTLLGVSLLLLDSRIRTAIFRKREEPVSQQPPHQDDMIYETRSCHKCSAGQIETRKARAVEAHVDDKGGPAYKRWFAEKCSSCDYEICGIEVGPGELLEGGSFADRLGIRDEALAPTAS